MKGFFSIVLIKNRTLVSTKFKVGPSTLLNSKQLYFVEAKVLSAVVRVDVVVVVLEVVIVVVGALTDKTLSAIHPSNGSPHRNPIKKKYKHIL